MAHRAAGRILGAAAFLAAGLAVAAKPANRIATLGEGGVQSYNNDVGSVANNGRLVAFGSSDPALLPDGDPQGIPDEQIYLRDVKRDLTTLLSHKADGFATSGGCYYPCISGNGKVVVFEHYGNDILEDDTNSASDIVAYDARTGDLANVSAPLTGAISNEDSWLYYGVAISDNGRLVAFTSHATNLVANDTNGVPDVFVRDLKAATTRRVSVSSDGAEGNGDSLNAAISANGRYVAFASSATNLAGVDGNGSADVFLHDLKTGTTERVSVGDDEAEGTDGSGDVAGESSVSVTKNGRLVCFTSNATNLVSPATAGTVHVFVRDRKAGTTRIVSVRTDGTRAVEHNGGAVMPASGKFVCFYSYDGLLAPGPDLDYDQFIHDLKTGVTRRAVSTFDGTAASDRGYAYSNGLSTNGKWLAFYSFASNIVDGDENDDWDLFLVSTR